MARKGPVKGIKKCLAKNDVAFGFCVMEHGRCTSYKKGV